MLCAACSMRAHPPKAADALSRSVRSFGQTAYARTTCIRDASATRVSPSLSESPHRVLESASISLCKCRAVRGMILLTGRSARRAQRLRFERQGAPTPQPCHWRVWRCWTVRGQVVYHGPVGHGLCGRPLPLHPRAGWSVGAALHVVGVQERPAAAGADAGREGFREAQLAAHGR